MGTNKLSSFKDRAAQDTLFAARIVQAMASDIDALHSAFSIAEWISENYTGGILLSADVEKFLDEHLGAITVPGIIFSDVRTNERLGRHYYLETYEGDHQ